MTSKNKEQHVTIEQLEQKAKKQRLEVMSLAEKAKQQRLDHEAAVKLQQEEAAAEVKRKKDEYDEIIKQNVLADIEHALNVRKLPEKEPVKLSWALNSITFNQICNNEELRAALDFNVECVQCKKAIVDTRYEPLQRQCHQCRSTTCECGKTKQTWNIYCGQCGRDEPPEGYH
jgi:hypothetical protein